MADSTVLWPPVAVLHGGGVATAAQNAAGAVLHSQSFRDVGFCVAHHRGGTGSLQGAHGGRGSVWRWQPYAGHCAILCNRHPRLCLPVTKSSGMRAEERACVLRHLQGVRTFA